MRNIKRWLNKFESIKDGEAQLLHLLHNNRKFYKNTGYNVINKGRACGKILGGNLCTLNLLQGTEFMPDLKDAVLFIEDDELTFPENFDRDLQSLIHQPDFERVKGIVIGRFQLASRMEDEKLVKIIRSKRELKNIPVISNVDFGHTTPNMTFPIGGYVELIADKEAEIMIKDH